MSYKKILVAIDRSPQASTVFDQALAIAQVYNCELILFHCLNWENQDMAAPFVGIGTMADIKLYGSLQKLQHESLQKEIEQVGNWLRTLCQQAELKNIKAEPECRVGTPGILICEEVRNWKADLIVIGRRGHKGISEFLLGSVSNYVVHYAPCSVLIVQGILSS